LDYHQTFGVYRAWEDKHPDTKFGAGVIPLRKMGAKKNFFASNIQVHVLGTNNIFGKRFMEANHGIIMRKLK